jgi:hypothetical protein
MTDAEVPCRWCGERHGKLCPWVKAIELRPDDTVSRVEFLTPNDYDAGRHEPPADPAPEQPDYPRLVPRTVKPEGQ